MDHTGFLYNEWMDDGHKFASEWVEAKKALDEEWELTVGENALWNEEDQVYYYIEEGVEWDKDQGVYVYTDTTTPVDFSAAEEIPMGENEGKYFSNNDLIGWGGPLTSACGWWMRTIPTRRWLFAKRKPVITLKLHLC